MTDMEHTILGRRDFLRMGPLGPLGFGLSKALGAGRGKDLACILIWQTGGCSHLDTFDLKPQAPREIRGEFREIPTKVPGLRICEHLPLTARQADKFTILRSMRSGETNHERATAAFERRIPGSRTWRLDVVGSRAFRLSAERRRLYERYGLTELGQGCLTARRMIEAGARFVVVGRGRPDYDTHTGNFGRLKDHLLPEFDRAFANLLEDLHERGLLESTLVVVAGEFGRSPRINREGGRDHHAQAWSVLLAGAGLPGGRVLGATDRNGAEVTDLPVAPEDLVRSIHAILGVQPDPSHLASSGRVIQELLA